MCLGRSNVLLLELPRQSYKTWMLEEIQNLSYALGIVPVLAHIERYLSWYKKQDFEELLSFDELVFQCNAESLLDRRAFRFLYDLAASGSPVVIGSDAHNMNDRAPHYDTALPALDKKRKGRLLLSCMQKSIRDMDIWGRR